MKAVVCREFGPVENLQTVEIPDPALEAGKVIIKVEAAGVNFPDSLLVQGLYQTKPPTPFIPGSEVCGTIEALGAGVEHLRIGQRVIAFCRTGGFAEKVSVDANMVMPLPSGIPSDEAAGILTAHATAHHALRQRGRLQQGEILLVTGAAGGTGLAAVQIGKAIGATVIAVCSSDEKLAVAKENGADVLINSTQGDLPALIKAATSGKGVDVAYETVGGACFDACVKNMAWNGRLLVVGFAGGEIPKLPINLTLVKGFSLVGVFWLTFTQKQPKEFIANMHELMQWYVQGKVKVVVDQVFTLDNTVQAIQKVTSRKVMGKVIVSPDPAMLAKQKLENMPASANDSMSIAKAPRSTQTTDVPRKSHFSGIAEAKKHVGQELGLSDWITIDQDYINRFADATGDHQWIHVDPERAAKESPFGACIAHGYLTLTLIPRLGKECFAVDNLHISINYGVQRARFITPVIVGSRLRARFTLQGIEDKASGSLVTLACSIEIEGQPKPACVAEILALWK